MNCKTVVMTTCARIQGSDQPSHKSDDLVSGDMHDSRAFQKDESNLSRSRVLEQSWRQLCFGNAPKVVQVTLVPSVNWLWLRGRGQGHLPVESKEFPAWVCYS